MFLFLFALFLIKYWNFEIASAVLGGGLESSYAKIGTVFEYY